MEMFSEFIFSKDIFLESLRWNVKNKPNVLLWFELGPNNVGISSRTEMIKPTAIPLACVNFNLKAKV